MSQLNSLPPPERRVPVASVSLVVHALSDPSLSHFIVLAEKWPEDFRGLAGESDNCQRLAGSMRAEGGRFLLSFLVAMGVRAVSHL